MKFFVLLIALLAYSIDVYALELRLVGDEVTTTNLAKKEEEEPFKLANTGDIFIDENIIRAVIGVNRRTTNLDFRLVSKYRTHVKIKWDNEDVVFLARNDSNRDYYLAYPGQSYLITLRATKAVSGNIYILNENNQIIDTYPYQVVHERPVNQSVRLSVSQSRIGDRALFTNNDTQSGSVSAGYSISQKQRFEDQGTWSANLNIYTDLDEEDKSITGSIGYSW